MKKYKIVLINIFIIALILFITDFYAFSTNMCYKALREQNSNIVYSYLRWYKSVHKYKIFFNKKVIDAIFLSSDYAKEDDASKWNLFRPIENKEQEQSILIFGCSYAYGFLLDNKQTFSYKLARLIPNYAIYNRALTGSTTSQMLYQLQNYNFKEAKNVKAVIYVFIPDHIMRNDNSHITMFFPYYRIKGDDIELEKISYKYVSTPLLIMAKQGYVNFLYDNYFSHCADEKNITHKKILLLKSILQASKKEITKKFGEDTKFIVFRYDRGNIEPYHWIFKELSKKKIDVISLRELSPTEFLTEEYQTKDKCHPNEKAWDTITLLILEYMKNSGYIN